MQNFINLPSYPPKTIKSFPWERLECPKSVLGNGGPEIKENQLKIFKLKLSFVKFSKEYLLPIDFLEDPIFLHHLLLLLLLYRLDL